MSDGAPTTSNSRTSPEPLRVLHLLAPAMAGGLESVVMQLASGQQARGLEIRVAAIVDPGTADGHPFIDALTAADVVVDRIEVGGREYRAERRAVAALLATHRIQVLHTHGYRPDVLDGPVARQLGCAHVMTLHGFIGGDWRGRLYEWLQVRAARRAHAAIAVSRPIETRVRAARHSGEVVWLPNAVAPCANALSRVEARAALGLPADGFIVGWIGRVSEEKGPDVFVDALAQCPPTVLGAMIGDGPMLPAVRVRAQASGLTARLTFAGMRPQASRYLAAFDVLALTSHTEGTPMVLLEAMWAHVPIVATAVGGVPDVLGQTYTLLTPAGDASSIAAAVARISANPALGADLATTAKSRVATTFGHREWIDRHVELYARALTRHG